MKYPSNTVGKKMRSNLVTYRRYSGSPSTVSQTYPRIRRHQLVVSSFVEAWSRPVVGEDVSLRDVVSNDVSRAVTLLRSFVSAMTIVKQADEQSLNNSIQALNISSTWCKRNSIRTLRTPSNPARIRQY